MRPKEWRKIELQREICQIWLQSVCYRLFQEHCSSGFLKVICSSFFCHSVVAGQFPDPILAFSDIFTRFSRTKNAWRADGRTDQPSYWDLWTHLTRPTRPIVVLEFTWIDLNSSCFRGFWENMSVEGRDSRTFGFGFEIFRISSICPCDIMDSPMHGHGWKTMDSKFETVCG